jgi:hypothetical protein
VNCSQVEEYWDKQYFNRTLHDSLKFQANLPSMGTIGNHEYYLPGYLTGNPPKCLPLIAGQTPDCRIVDQENA